MSLTHGFQAVGISSPGSGGNASASRVWKGYEGVEGFIWEEIPLFKAVRDGSV